MLVRMRLFRLFVWRLARGDLKDRRTQLDETVDHRAPAPEATVEAALSARGWVDRGMRNVC